MSSLFDIRNAFFLGNFQQAINEAQKSQADSIEKDVLLYRSYIAIKKYGLVLNEISSNSSSPQLKPVRLLAEYYAGDSSKRQQIIDQLNSTNFSSDEGYTWPLVAGIIYYSEKNYQETLRALHNCDDLECLALRLQTLLTIDRFDKAIDTLKKMQEIDEDSTLTQLCTAAVNLSLGSDKIQEAFYIYQELIDKYHSTPLLCNGMAAAMFCSNRVSDAESFLQQALEKNSDQPETLINFMFLLNHQGKQSELIDRYLNQLRDSSPNHSYLVDLKNKDEEFDRLASMYA